MYEQSNKANFQVVTCLYPKLEMYYQIRAVLYPPLYLSIFFSSLRFFPVLLLLRPFLTLKKKKGFPGGAVVGSLPANAGNMGLSPGPGGSHMPRSSWACAPQLLSLRSRTHEPQQLKPVHLEPVLHKRSHRNEKPTHRNEEWPPLTTTRESLRAATKIQRSQKYNK